MLLRAHVAVIEAPAMAFECAAPWRKLAQKTACFCSEVNAVTIFWFDVDFKRCLNGVNAARIDFIYQCLFGCVSSA